MVCRLSVVAMCFAIVLGNAAAPSAAGRIVPRERSAGSKSKNTVVAANPLDLQTRDLASGLTIDSILAALLGTSSIAISNVQFTGSDSALGVFTGGTGIIGFEQGIVLSSGLVANVVGQNDQTGAGYQFGRAGDPDLDSLIVAPDSTLDACVLEFDFECPAVREIGFEYVFSSEEYNEFVYASFNDVFGFFVNGKNIALLPDGVTVVSIDNVNGGKPFGDTNASNPEHYINNECETTDPPCPLNTQMDGLTVVLIARAKIQPGPNHIKLAIADAGDAAFDSDVFLKGQSFVCGAVNNTAPVCQFDPPSPITVTAGENVSFTITGTDADTGQSIYLSVLFSIPQDATMNPGLPLAGPHTGVSSEFNWLPTQPGSYFANFLLTDSLGGVDSCEIDIEVLPAVNNPPECAINPSGPFNIPAGENLSFTVTGTDPDDGQTIFLYQLGNPPPGATMTPSLPRAGSRTGLSSQFAWTPTQAGSYFASFFVTDSLGGADTCVAQINVSQPQANRPPVCTIDPPGPYEVRVGTALNFSVIGTDPDTGQILMLSQFPLPGGVTMTPPLPVSGPSGVSSQFSWMPDRPATWIVRFFVKDDSGAEDTDSTIITVLDITAPFIVAETPANGATEVSWSQFAGAYFDLSEFLADSTIPDSIPVWSRQRGRLWASARQWWQFPELRVHLAECPDDDSLWFVLPGTMQDWQGTGFDGNKNGIPEGSPIDDYVFSFTTSPGVYPGDANDDGTVDERDVLPLGVHYLRTGEQRPRNTDTWTLEPASPWIPREATHADCDGNGIIDSLDICIILEFFDRNYAAKSAVIDYFNNAIASLDDPVRASLLNALLNCEQGTAAARAALIRALEAPLESTAPLPAAFILEQNYPNPFNAGTVISWQMAQPGRVELSIFDVLGHRVRKLIDTDFPAGFHAATWDGADDDARAMASGVYVYRIVAGDQSAAKSMVLIR